MESGKPLQTIANGAQRPPATVNGSREWPLPLELRDLFLGTGQDDCPVSRFPSLSVPKVRRLEGLRLRDDLGVGIAPWAWALGADTTRACPDTLTAGHTGEAEDTDRR